MISDKKLACAIGTLFVTVCASDMPENLQLASGGEIVITFDNALKSLSFKTLQGEQKLSVRLPSFESDKGSALKLDSRRKKIALGYFASKGTVDVVDIESAKVTPFKHNGDAEYHQEIGCIKDLSWSQDGNLLGVCSAYQSGPCWVIDMRNGKRCFRRPTIDNVYTAVIDPQGKNILAGHTTPLRNPTNGRVSVFDLESSNSHTVFDAADHPADVYNIVFSKDGALCACMHDDGVCFRKAGDCSHHGSVAINRSLFPQGAFNDDATRYALAVKNYIEIIDTETMKTVKMIPYLGQFAYQVDWHGETLAVASQEQGVITWDMSKE